MYVLSLLHSWNKTKVYSCQPNRAYSSLNAGFPCGSGDIVWAKKKWAVMQSGQREEWGEWEEKGEPAQKAPPPNQLHTHLSKCDQIALKYHADVAPWQQNKCGVTYFSSQNDRSLLRININGYNSQKKRGRREIGPSYNDYRHLCGLYVNVQYRNTGPKIGFENISSRRKNIKGNLLLSCAVFYSPVLCRKIITPNVYAVSVQQK